MNLASRLWVRRQFGVTLLEVLVTIVLTAFGLLGLAAVVSRSAAISVESNQRARAAALLEDMENRIRNNKADAGSYALATVHGAKESKCAGTATRAELDLCEWNNLLVGTNDALTTDDGLKKLGFRGCITQPVVKTPVYVITVAWGAAVLATPPADPCGANLFGDDGFRRVIRTLVRVPALGG